MKQKDLDVWVMAIRKSRDVRGPLLLRSFVQGHMSEGTLKGQFLPLSCIETFVETDAVGGKEVIRSSPEVERSNQAMSF